MFKGSGIQIFEDLTKLNSDVIAQPGKASRWNWKKKSWYKSCSILHFDKKVAICNFTAQNICMHFKTESHIIDTTEE